MTAQKVALILEVVSFFCVTIDLYGEERLERLRRRLIGDTGGTHRFSLADIIKSMDREHWFYRIIRTSLSPVTLLLYIGVAMYLSTAIFGSWTEYSISDFVRREALFWLIVIVAIVSSFRVTRFVVSMTMTTVIATVVLVLDRLIRLALFILVRKRLEGVLVWIGAALFLISKYIAFVSE